MFASFIAKNNLTISVLAFFYVNTATANVANIIGYQIPVDCYTEKLVIVLGGTGGDSLSYIRLTNNFHSQMPRTMKIANSTNNSNAISTPTSATTENFTTFSNVLHDVERRFKIEKDAKNEAYSFILSMGLLDEFQKFSRATKGQNHFANCLNHLIQK